MELRLYLKHGSRGATILGCCLRARGLRALHRARGGKADGVSGTGSGDSCAIEFRESDNFRFAFLLGLAPGHEFLHQVVHDVGDRPAGLISQFSKLHQRGLIERVQWTAVQRERRDVPRRCFHPLRCLAFAANARKF